MQINVVNHPLLQAKMTILRDKDTKSVTFRHIISEVAALLTFETTRDLPVEEVKVTTPLCETTGCRIKGSVTVVPILRAGLGFMEGVLSVIPEANVGHIGMSRNEETLLPMEYYCKLPDDIGNRQVFVVDPMLATGGSAIAAIDFLKQHGCKNIIMMNIIGAPEGVEAVTTAHPDVDVYLAALDERLNENAYIVPGLGDAGDRIFGTK